MSSHCELSAPMTSRNLFNTSFNTANAYQGLELENFINTTLLNDPTPYSENFINQKVESQSVSTRHGSMTEDEILTTLEETNSGDSSLLDSE